METDVKEIKCPKCNIVALKEDSEIIKCNKCKNNYIYKYCLECSQIIFFNNIFSDGYAITCPYISCGATHFSVKCNCKNVIYFKNKYSQGDLIKCSNCKSNFKKVKCPYVDCPNNIFLSPKFVEGNSIECKHSNGNFIFQKVGCWYCGRHSVWNNSRGKFYIEGQMIICPYKECERITNKVTCPKCFETSIITRGNLDMGKKINCSAKGCDCVYSIFFCPYCKKTNYGNSYPIVGSNIICNFCKGEFCFINCYACKQIHFWKKPNNYLPCQTVVCQNEGCKKKFCVISCPICKKINYFPKGNFTLGKIYECNYKDCKFQFVILYCGKCNMTYKKKANLDPETLYTCEKCHNIMPSVQCPKCLQFLNLEDNNKIESHSIVKCPYEDCGITFYYYICPFCKHDFNSNTYSFSNIKCPYDYCNKSFTYFKCNKCLKENIIEETDNNKNDCQEINCLYCNENNNIDKVDENKIIKAKKVIITQGEKYVFDNPEEDPYDRLIVNNLIMIKNYEISFEEKKLNDEKKENHDKMCVICMANEIKWILVDCGHKCVCEVCGEIVEEKFKKCPICKKKIIGVLKKVIDDD